MAAQRSECGMALQNVYDNPTFFEQYRRLRDEDSGLNGALEQPALQALLPSMAAKRVLDLGCGFGHFARQARAAGAECVTAVDLSERMLTEAIRRTSDPEIHFVRSAVEDFESSASSCDLVVSSLALHYVLDYEGVIKRVARWLRPGGSLVFSVEHPIATANPSAWIRNERGEKLHWALDHYSAEGQRRTSWFIEGVVKYHRTVATYVNGLLDAGLQLRRLAEPVPVLEAAQGRPELESEFRRPAFLLLAADKP